MADCCISKTPRNTYEQEPTSYKKALKQCVKETKAKRQQVLQAVRRRRASQRKPQLVSEPYVGVLSVLRYISTNVLEVGSFIAREKGAVSMSELLNKKLTVTLSFSIKVSDTPFEALGDVTSEEAEHLARQKRFLLALINNKPLFQKEIMTLIASEMEGKGGWKEWGELFFGEEMPDDDEIKAAVIATLDPQDAKFFQKLLRSGYFSDHTDALFESMQVEVTCLGIKDEL